MLSMFKLTDQNTAKSAIRFAARKLGLEIHRSDPVGHEPFMDMRRLSGSRRGTVIFDVGANAGQTIKRFSEAFESPVIHAFEPSQQTFADLQRNTRLGSVHLNNFALGAEPGTLEFNENTISDMSSFHELGPDGWGSIQRRISVEVRTIDDYCVQNRISSIDILKSDTQGFDLEVLKGASRCFSQNRIHLIYIEITFSRTYKNQPRVDEIFKFLMDCGFALVTFYRFKYKNNRADWSDALFINLHSRISGLAKA